VQPKRILVVDDEREIVRILETALADWGYEAVGAPDARAALALVREQVFDGAIFDFHLPDMNGIMLHHRVHAMDEELAARTLFISGFEQPDDKLGYFESEASGFLRKPLHLPEVRRKLAELLRRK
jgi:DNA-binding response OmpR family regulator